MSGKHASRAHWAPTGTFISAVVIITAGLMLLGYGLAAYKGLS